MDIRKPKLNNLTLPNISESLPIVRRRTDTTIIPKEVAQSYIRTYFEAIGDLETYKPIIEVFSEVNDEVWKWI